AQRANMLAQSSSFRRPGSLHLWQPEKQQPVWSGGDHRQYGALEDIPNYGTSERGVYLAGFQPAKSRESISAKHGWGWNRPADFRPANSGQHRWLGCSESNYQRSKSHAVRVEVQLLAKR